MCSHLRRFCYGNEDISESIDKFRLEGNLRISASEQVELLRHFLADDLGRSGTTTATKGYHAAGGDPDPSLKRRNRPRQAYSGQRTWLAGRFLEQDHALYCYALNREGGGAGGLESTKTCRPRPYAPPGAGRNTR